MSQEIADSIRADFKTLSGNDVKATYMAKGDAHRPTSLKSGTCGVYVFLIGTQCLKVGKAGSRSKARWNSHHYNLDETTPSTLPKSIIKNMPKFKACLSEDLRGEADGLCKANIQAWIKKHICRIELVIDSSEDLFALNLLEALAQFRLRPLFEGRNA